FTEVQVEYTEEDMERYTVPLGFASGERADQLRAVARSAVLASACGPGSDGGVPSGGIYDALLDKSFCLAMVKMIARRRHLRGVSGEFAARPTRVLRQELSERVSNLEVSSMRAEQTNSSIVFGDQYILKLFRKVETGLNPDLELGRFLTQR